MASIVVTFLPYVVDNYFCVFCLHSPLTVLIMQSASLFVFLPQIAREHGIRFLETSAKTNVNIEQAFYNLAEDILKKQLSKDNEETSQNIHVSNNQDKKGGCC